MKKQQLLEYFDDSLLDKLFGFCYARTNDSYEAKELCSDIVYALVKAARSEGEIANPHAFIWKVAHNVYADYSENRRRRQEALYDGDAEDILRFIPDNEQEDDTAELLGAVYRRIAFLTKAYREVMIMFYIDGLSTAEIAKAQNASETAVRQRLFSARRKIKSEVEKMTETYNKPLALEKMDFCIWGTGNPAWGDPRPDYPRMLSNHIIWLCSKKPMSASEIAEILNVPTVYIEEELEILTKGSNGSYGFLRKMDSGKYAINFILLDTPTAEKAHAIYKEQIPMISQTISDYIEKHKDEYLSFPYLNKRVDLNLIIWQQIYTMATIFSCEVENILEEKYFSQYEKPDRPFSVFGYVENGKDYGGGHDSLEAVNICGFSLVQLHNIYITRIRKHFGCGLNVSTDLQIQLALRAIDGLCISTLSEADKEHAAKAIECGYLYRDGDMLYTKILTSSIADNGRLFDITYGLNKGVFAKDAEAVAEKIAALIKKSVPEYLLGEWYLANVIAGMPVIDAVVEGLIDKGILTPPENGIGAEGCWMCVMK